MARVTLYSVLNCAFCSGAKAMLDKWGIDYEELRIDADKATKREFDELTQGAQTVPQIIIDGKLIGGFTELTELHMDGELDELMHSD